MKFTGDEYVSQQLNCRILYVFIGSILIFALFQHFLSSKRQHAGEVYRAKGLANSKDFLNPWLADDNNLTCKATHLAWNRLAVCFGWEGL